MTKDCIIDCISVLKSNYGGFNYSKNEFIAFVNLWEKQFKNNSDSEVSSAVMQIIATEEYRPTIARIKQEIARNTIDTREDFEVWDFVLSSARASYDDAYDEWQHLPEDIKKAVSPSLLVEIGRSTDNSLQFLRKEVLASYNAQHNNRTRNYMIGNIDIDLIDSSNTDSNLIESNESEDTKSDNSKDDYFFE